MGTRPPRLRRVTPGAILAVLLVLPMGCGAEMPAPVSARPTSVFGGTGPITTTPVAEPVTATPIPTDRSVGQPGEGRDAILQSMRRLETAFPRHETEETRVAGQVYTRTQDSVAPDRYRTVWTTTPGGQSGEIIRLQTSFFVRNDGRWSTATEEPRASLGRVPARSILTEGLRTAQPAVPTQPNLRAFTFTFDLARDASQGSGTVWIDASTGLPQRAEIRGSFAGIPAEAIFTWVADPSIRVDAPVR